MITLTPTRCRVARQFARLGTVVSAGMLVLGLTAGSHPEVSAATAENAGAVQLKATTAPIGPITSGGSATAFAMVLPSGAACQGTALTTPSYRWETYIVSSSVNMSALTFGSGPNPVSGAFVSALYSASSGSPVSNKNPSLSPVGLISGIPQISLSTLTIPAGSYRLGVACAADGATSRYWSIDITVTADASDTPGHFTWVVGSGGGGTTTTTVAPTTSTSTTVGGSTTTTTTHSTTTTTTVGGGTTTTTTTTTTGGSTTSTATGDSGFGTTTTVDLGSGGVTTTTTYQGQLVATGYAPGSPLVWGVLCLVFGRMAILLGRRVKVLPAGAS